MKKHTIALLGLSLCAPAFISQAQEPATPAPAPAAEAAAPAPALSDAEVKEIISYFVGFQTGIQFAQFGEGPVALDDFDKDTFFRAIGDGLKNRVDPAIEKKDLQAAMAAFTAKLNARNKELGDANLAKSKEFFAENGKKEGVTTTASGLQYKVITPADGRKYDEAKDGAGALASISYEGRLRDGTVFDKSEQPIDLPISGVIPGFAEALKLMPIGSEWEIYIPSELGYGENGPGVLGAHAALIFKVKLQDIKPKKGDPQNPIELTPEMIKQLQEAGMQPM